MMNRLATKILLLFIFSLCIQCGRSVTKTIYEIPETAGLAHYFNIKEYRPSGSPVAALLVLDPIFFNIEALDQLCNYFASKGYLVLLLEIKDLGPPITLPDESQLVGAIEMQKRSAPEMPIFAMGVSLGGISWVPVLNPGHTALTGMVFIGTGFDYEYPGSFQNTIKGYRQEGTSLAELCMKPGRCPGFMRPDLAARSVRLKSLPLKPRNLSARNTTAAFSGVRIPTIFVSGKIDSISPEESIYPAIRSMPGAVTSQPESPYFYFEASTANGLDNDYDHFDLFLSNDAVSELYPVIEDWMHARRTKN